MKSDVVRLRITPELKEKVKAAAEKENRTVSNWIENLIRNNLKEEKRIMEKFTVNGTEYELLITQDAYITGTNNFTSDQWNAYYEGKGIDKDGREYWLTWEILKDYEPGNGEEYACDWSKPVAIDEAGRTLDDMIYGGESRSNPGEACYYIIIRNGSGEEVAYAEELVGEPEDEETFARLIENIKEQLK